VAHNFTSLEEKHNTENTEKDRECAAGWEKSICRGAENAEKRKTRTGE
jgi:hypothetical protein